MDLIKRQRDVPEKGDRIVVGFVQANPSEAAAVLPGPLAQRRGLAITRGRDEENQGHLVLDRGEGPEQPVAAHKAWTIRWTGIFDDSPPKAAADAGHVTTVVLSRHATVSRCG